MNASPELFARICLKDAGDIEVFTLDAEGNRKDDEVNVPRAGVPWLAFELLREKYGDHVSPAEFLGWCTEHCVEHKHTSH
jgi:hypothetical protein